MVDDGQLGSFGDRLPFGLLIATQKCKIKQIETPKKSPSLHGYSRCYFVVDVVARTADNA